MAEKVLEGAGAKNMLNNAFASEIAKVTDEETGTIDVDALNKNDLTRYRSSINHMVGKDAEAYDVRMQKVFGTSDYIDTVAKILEPGDLWTLQRIAQRNPGDNPLADALAKRFNESEDLAA